MGKKFPIYVWGIRFLPLSLKPTNFSLYVWKMSKYFQPVIFSVKFNKITMSTNAF